MADDNKKLEACRQENRELVYVLSHDLREPLRMVSAYMDLFAERYAGRVDDSADKFIQYALEGARRAERMLDGLLEYSRVTNRDYPRETVDIANLFRSVAERLVAEYPDVKFTIEYSPMPALVTNATLVRQLVHHLLDNAIKFRHPDRPLEITVHAAQTADRWEFTIADNGIGFEPRFAERIFEIFQSLHPIGRYAGVGIGLAVGRRIVETLGGSIRAEGRPGDGAVVTFSLPVAEEEK